MTTETNPDGTNTGGAPAQPVQQPGAAPERETFSKEYVSELREEAKAYRLKLREAEDAHAAAAKALEDTNTANAAKLAATEQAATQRVVMAEIKTAALKAGLRDMDALKLLDLSSVKLNDDGTVSGADELLEKAKTDKAYLFGEPATSKNAETPKPDDKSGSDVRTLSKADYEARKAKALSGR